MLPLCPHRAARQIYALIKAIAPAPSDRQTNLQHELLLVVVFDIRRLFLRLVEHLLLLSERLVHDLVDAGLHCFRYFIIATTRVLIDLRMG